MADLIFVFVRDVDKFMAENRDFLVLAAAGNDGESGDNTVGNPATCKNCVAVGASGNVGANNYSGVSRVSYVNERAPFSSIGPTADGRLKPDVMAPGARARCWFTSVMVLLSQVWINFDDSVVQSLCRRYCVLCG